MALKFKDKSLSLDQPRIMGVLNVTPDSFSDGGKFTALESARHHALKMARDGASIIDVGGESTRPGADPVSLDEELQRVIPVIQAIRRESDIIISIDTSKPEVMRQAVAAGADLINDVNALRAEGAVETAKRCAVPVCLMHMLGEPRTMQQDPQYRDVLQDVYDFLQQRVEVCVKSHIPREQIIVDPGFGFGKSLQHNLSLLKHLEKFKGLDLPLLVGFSRKSMIEKLLGERPIGERLAASLTLALEAVSRGAKIIRVHDVAATRDALQVRQALLTSD